MPVNPRKPGSHPESSDLTVTGFQQLIRDIYFKKDSRRGADGTYRWLVEETGELARALRKGDRANMAEEFADVFAWLASLASIQDIDLAAAAGKYANGCPKCFAVPCKCQEPGVRTGPRRRGPKGGR